MKVYEKIYNYYIEAMESGLLKENDKMPSLRECCKLLNASRTSAETAYMMLAADGYIYSQEKVGFFVTDMAKRTSNNLVDERSDISSAIPVEKKYDFETIKEDPEVSCLELWRRYMKSALRQEERLLSYAFNQGELELREEIVRYVRKNRNIICGPEDIVIGAGFQNLLMILIPLIGGEKTVSFPTKSFKDGAKTFENAGYSVEYRAKDCHVLYVTPAYMTKWGAVMSVKRRQEITDHAISDDHLIIEDDYQNEFVFSSHPTPSLYAMNGGENVAFLGSFSRVLLPSVRISFLILPKGYRNSYLEEMDYYNQTASKAEQIALAQFLRDGHMQRHIKKMRRLYEEKRFILASSLEKYLGNDAEIFVGESGMEIGIGFDSKDFSRALFSSNVSAIIMEDTGTHVTALLSCSGISKDLIEDGVKELQQLI